MSDDWDGLVVTEQGAGAGVLWLHGYTMRAEVWRPLWALLPGWRHVGLDLPWHGRSRALRAGEGRAGLAGTIAAGAHASGVRHVVALSFGTVLAVEMAVRHPAGFASWTLAAPALAGMRHEPDVVGRYIDLAMLHRRAGPGPHLRALWMRCPPAIFAGVLARPALHRSLAGIIDTHGWTELADGGMRRLAEPAQDARDLGALRAPVLLLVGGDELPAHRRCADAIEAAVPAAVQHVLPGAAHLAPLEEPAAAAPVIAAHLRRSERLSRSPTAPGG